MCRWEIPRQRQGPGAQCCRRQIDNDPVRVGQGEEIVGPGARQPQLHTGVLALGGDRYGLDLELVCRGCKQHGSGQEHACKGDCPGEAEQGLGGRPVGDGPLANHAYYPRNPFRGAEYT